MMTHKQFEDYAKYLGATINTYKGKDGQTTLATFICGGTIGISFCVRFTKGSCTLQARSMTGIGWDTINLNELEVISDAITRTQRLHHYMENFKS